MLSPAARCPSRSSSPWRVELGTAVMSCPCSAEPVGDVLSLQQWDLASLEENDAWLCQRDVTTEPQPGH